MSQYEGAARSKAQIDSVWSKSSLDSLPKTAFEIRTAKGERYGVYRLSFQAGLFHFCATLREGVIRMRPGFCFKSKATQKGGKLMKDIPLQSLNGNVFTQLDTEECHALGGSTVFMTLQTTFVAPRIFDRFFDEKTDF
ncbi:MAG: hypothetical protein ACREDR_19145 [Blastocatellia bacterium]